MVAFFYLSFTFFFEHFLQGTMDLMLFSLKSYSYLLFKHFLQGIIGLRCSMVTFVYLIFTFCLSNFCKELRTSGVGWLHDSILSPPSFLSTFCKELRTSSVGWLHVLISSLPSFFSTFCPELQASGVGWLHFSILVLTFFFEHFLQGTMDLRHRLITSPQRHLTNSLQTACGHLTILTPPAPPIRRVRGGVRRGVRGDLSLTDFHPPSLNVNLPGHVFDVGGV